MYSLLTEDAAPVFVWRDREEDIKCAAKSKSTLEI
jgi:hypothetical protein